jgi:hypothetical protein
VSNWTFPPPPPPGPPPAPPVDEQPDVAADTVAGVSVMVGDVVKVVWFDTGLQADVVRYGTVVDVDETGARVAYFAEVTDPIPLDPDVHERVDAPRVEVIGHVGG